MNVLLAIDLDGTLLTDNGEITISTLSSLSKAQEKGATICIVTGRELISALKILNKYSLKYNLICYNGAKIINIGNGQEYYSKYIENEYVNMIVKFCLINKIIIYVFGEQFCGVTGINNLVENFINYTNEKPKIIKDINDIKNIKVINLVAIENIPMLKRYIEDNNIEVSIVSSDPFSLDIMAKNVSKGDSLKKLADILGFKENQIISIGNYYNDVYMFKESHIGIAIQNAPEDVKVHADYVTKNTNNQDGVKEAIEKFIL